MPLGFFWWDWQFADRIFRLRSIERHADATSKYTCGMAQLLSRGLAALCRCVPRGIVWTYLYTPRLQITVTCVNGKACCNFHGTVQCHRQMLRIAVMLQSNFLHLVTSSWTALAKQRSSQRCYITHLFQPLKIIKKHNFQAEVRAKIFNGINNLTLRAGITGFDEKKTLSDVLPILKVEAVRKL